MMDLKPIIERIQRLANEGLNRKIEQTQLMGDQQTPEFDYSIAPNVSEPIAVPVDMEEGEDPDWDPSPKKEGLETVQETQFDFSKALKDHHLFRCPSSIKHLDHCLFGYLSQYQEPLQLTATDMTPPELMQCPLYRDIAKMQTELIITSLLDRAEVARDKKDWLQAFQLYNKAVGADSKCHRAYFGLGLAHAHDGLMGKAIENLAHATQFDPSNRTYIDQLYNAHIAHGLAISVGNLEEAIKIYRAATELDPERKEAPALLKQAEQILQNPPKEEPPKVSDVKKERPDISNRPLKKVRFGNASYDSTSGPGPQVTPSTSGYGCRFPTPSSSQSQQRRRPHFNTRAGHHRVSNRGNRHFTVGGRSNPVSTLRSKFMSKK